MYQTKFSLQQQQQQQQQQTHRTGPPSASADDKEKENLRPSQTFNHHTSSSSHSTDHSSTSSSSSSSFKHLTTTLPTSSSASNQPKELEGYVGFANLPNQIYRKSVKRGFEFNLMVVGESGLGKSTLVNTLFLCEMYSADNPGPSLRPKKTTQVDTSKILLKENGVQLQLTIVDTPGFGDQVDNTNCWDPIIDYIDTQFDTYLNCESRINRRRLSDNRIHCCLYFLQPTGHGLKPLDVEFMKRLHTKVNIIPVIGKADTLTSDECAAFKKQILKELADNKIQIYEFPELDEEEDKTNKQHKSRVPLAVIGSNTVIEVNGKKLRGRQYPWGIVEVENLQHNDFICLRNMVIRTHMQDLKDVTNNVHYENFRCRKLAQVTSAGDAKQLKSAKNPLVQFEEEKQEHMNKMKKMEAEMEQVFEMKVKEKKQKLKDQESDLEKKNEMFRKTLEDQSRDLEEKRKQFDKERNSWEEQQRSYEEQQKRNALDTSKTMDAKKKKEKKSLF